MKLDKSGLDLAMILRDDLPKMSVKELADMFDTIQRKAFEAGEIRAKARNLELCHELERLADIVSESDRESIEAVLKGA